MDILVQDVGTGGFWDTNQFVPDIASARAFSSSAEAIHFCVTHRLRGIRLVLHFDDARDDIYLKPLPDQPVTPLNEMSFDADAKMAELAAMRESMREQETQMQGDIDDIARRIDTMHQRLRFARKSEQLRTDSDGADA